MSEDLRDEVEALNSIYGEGCLAPSEDQDESPASSSTTYILQLPGDEASSLRLQFPDSYPAEPPTVLGTQHSSGGRKGAGARDLGVFREALGTVFQPGSVCLFDAVEEFVRRMEEEREREELVRQQEGDDGDDGEGVNADRGERAVDGGQTDFAAMTPPPWTLSEVVVENKSTFVAHVARVSSPAEAKLFFAAPALVRPPDPLGDAQHHGVEDTRAGGHELFRLRRRRRGRCWREAAAFAAADGGLGCDGCCDEVVWRREAWAEEVCFD
ncbi:hypothetical protein TrVGV298_000381 [Trichoderma virens]|nr:hypothetical protein TrVGV298_000381 [Trichoderma virens]